MNSYSDCIFLSFLRLVCCPLLFLERDCMQGMRSQVILHICSHMVKAFRSRRVYQQVSSSAIWFGISNFLYSPLRKSENGRPWWVVWLSIYTTLYACVYIGKRHPPLLPSLSLFLLVPSTFSQASGTTNCEPLRRSCFTQLSSSTSFG